MTIEHPSALGSRVTLWFVGDEPVRLTVGDDRLAVVGQPKDALINGLHYWRLRARTSAGRIATLDLRQADDGWILAGVEEHAAVAGSR